MSWEDRIQEAAYTSPSGVRMTFKYENVSESINKRDTVREPTDYQGAVVQNFGVGALSYPLLAIFWGEDHDKEALEFTKILLEPGAGILEHPFYGRLENMVPLGPIRRRDDLKTAANQTIFEINFVQSSAFQFPAAIVSVSDQIEFDLDAFYRDQAIAFNAGINIESAREKIDLVDSVRAKLNNVKRFMGKIAATVSEIENEFNNAIELAQDSIDTLVGTPLALANQLINIIKLPARAASQITATLEAYQNLLQSTIADANGLFTPTVGNRINNQFYNADLFSATAMGGMLSASLAVADATREISGQSLENFVAQEPEEIPSFISKSSIIDTINFLDSEFTTLNEWNEANRASLDLLDTGETYSFLKKSSNGVAGFLVGISFSARQERQIVLGNPRNFIELCAELYGFLDTAFDFFILTNNINSDEMFELPRGRLIKYYV